MSKRMIDIPTNWTPTPCNVNKLPQPIVEYIHGLESLCDPAHIIMENTLLRDQTLMLDAKIAKLKKCIKKLKIDLCKKAIATIAIGAAAHTREVFAMEAAALIQDLIDGKIDHGEFLLCSAIDEPVNNV